jgi:hypothetical protein
MPLSNYLEPPPKGRLLHEKKRRENVQIADRDSVIAEDPYVPSSQEQGKLERAEKTHYMQNDADYRASNTRSGRFRLAHPALPNRGLGGPLA